jgi:hypothetical protein
MEQGTNKKTHFPKNKHIASFTKMGYAGNFEPNYIIPTTIADSEEKVQKTHI